jgi:hypothetical protein
MGSHCDCRELQSAPLDEMIPEGRMSWGSLLAASVFEGDEVL